MWEILDGTGFGTPGSGRLPCCLEAAVCWSGVVCLLLHSVSRVGKARNIHGVIIVLCILLIRAVLVSCCARLESPSQSQVAYPVPRSTEWQNTTDDSPTGTTLVLLGWCSTQLAMDSTWPRVALPTRPSIHYLHGSRTRPVPPCLCQLVVGTWR